MFGLRGGDQPNPRLRASYNIETADNAALRSFIDEIATRLFGRDEGLRQCPEPRAPRVNHRYRNPSNSGVNAAASVQPMLQQRPGRAAEKARSLTQGGSDF